ncbi:LmeA family phospholipid-binding protein [Mycobacterium sp. NPDC003449]
MPTPPQRPGQPGWRGRGTPPPDPATRRLPRPAAPEPPTEQIRARRQPPDAAATEQIHARRQPPDAMATEKIARPRPPAAERPGGAPPPPPQAPPPARPADGADGPKARGRSPRLILLIAVIVVALVFGGLAVAELYARHRAGTVLGEVTQCVVEDGATISFGVKPPFLWQHVTGHYTNITVETAGHRVQAAEGMTAEVSLSDIRLQDSADSKGTIGSLDATLSWTADGIKDTVADNLPGVGSLVTGVSTDPAAGTLILEAAGDNRVTAQPVVTDGDLGLRVLDVTGPFSKDTVQSALDGLTITLNDNYPLGIHADSVEVTDTGVVGQFSSRDASIPNDEADPCFAQI